MQKLFLKALSLIVMILGGYLLKRKGIFRAEDAKVLSKAIIYLTLPAALINSFRTFVFDATYLTLILISVGANVFGLIISQVVSRNRNCEIRAMYGLNMTSYNIGTFVLPFAQSFLPVQALVGVSMFDAGNCPFNAGLDYALVAPREEGEKIKLRFIANKLVHSVPFMTFLILILIAIFHITLPVFVYTVTGTVGNANAFLAMLMIGIGFEPHFSADNRKDIFVIIGLRYLLGILLAVIIWFASLPLLIRQVSVLALLAPIPSIAMVYCEKCGCKTSVYTALNSLCIVISLFLTLAALPFLQI